MRCEALYMQIYTYVCAVAPGSVVRVHGNANRPCPNRVPAILRVRFSLVQVSKGSRAHRSGVRPNPEVLYSREERWDYVAVIIVGSREDWARLSMKFRVVVCEERLSKSLVR